MDVFSRYLVAVPIRDKSAQSVAKVLLHHVIFQFGCFQSLITDNGKEYCNQIVSHLCQMMRNDQLRITFYRPASNGRCDIMNKTLHALLGRMVAENQKDWSAWLPFCVLAYNTTRHGSTGQTPYRLMFGREAMIPLDLLLDHSQAFSEMDYCDFVHEAERKMRQIVKMVQKHQNQKVQRMVRYYNVGVKA